MDLPAPRPSHDAIARRAYDLYLERGNSGGDPLHDWLRAEAELIMEMMEASRRDGEAAPATRAIAERRPRQSAPRKPRARTAAPSAAPASAPRARSPRS